jgi:hypothetical protein
VALSSFFGLLTYYKSPDRTMEVWSFTKIGAAGLNRRELKLRGRVNLEMTKLL